MTVYNDINQQLLSFDSHTLEDLSQAKLMRRVDTKYVIPIVQLNQLLDALKGHCSVLTIDERRISQYRTQYYDSPELRFYHDHHNGSLERHKVRCRSYVEQNNSYLEVKLKNNKGRTIKQRLAVKDGSLNVLRKHQLFLTRCGINKVEQLIDTQTCSYYRAAFVCKLAKERLTLDFNLSYLDNHTRQRAFVDDLAIIEIKQNRFNRSSDIYKALKENKHRACSFSKYCIGMSLLRDKTLKSNGFKETLLKLRKLNREQPGGRLVV